MTCFRLLDDHSQMERFVRQYAPELNEEMEIEFSEEEDPTVIPDGFDIDAAMRRLTVLNNKMYHLYEKSQRFIDMEALLPEALFLQRRVLHFWLPHPLSGLSYPKGRATSGAMLNYLYYLIEIQEYDTAFSFLEKHFEEKIILAA